MFLRKKKKEEDHHNERSKYLPYKFSTQADRVQDP